MIAVTRNTNSASNSTLYSPYEATAYQHATSTTPGSSPGILQSPARAALPLPEILFMACAETACLPKVGAFLRCTIQLGTALTHIIKDPTAVGICAYFETSGILVRQQLSERSRNLCLHPIPILLQRHHFQSISFGVLYQATTQGHLEQKSIERC